MPLLQFEGSSDDTFGEVAHFRDDYDNCASGEPIVYRIDWNAEGFYVVGWYSSKPLKNGCWSIAIAPLDEDVPMPSWPARIEANDRGYSPLLSIEAPEGVRLTCVTRDQNRDEDDED